MIRTERLVLRRATWDDLEAVHLLMSDPRAMRYWSRPEHETLEETRHWLRFLVEPAADSRDFLIEKEGEVIGKAGAWQLPEVGFLLHPDQWGKGLAFEAMTAVIAHVEAEFEVFIAEPGSHDEVYLNSIPARHQHLLPTEKVSYFEIILARRLF